jgi:hypothetical protein
VGQRVGALHWHLDLSKNLLHKVLGFALEANFLLVGAIVADPDLASDCRKHFVLIALEQAVELF